MDEDLKIVLTSELEADEEASAQRISAQLPNIAKLINSKSGAGNPAGASSAASGPCAGGFCPCQLP